MDSNEQYVREKWERVSEFDGCPRINFNNHSPFLKIFKSWSAAADFTRAHEKKISDVGEEIALLKVLIRVRQQAGPQEDATCQRILAARQAALDKMKRGWRG